MNSERIVVFFKVCFLTIVGAMTLSAIGLILIAGSIIAKAMLAQNTIFPHL